MNVLLLGGSGFLSGTLARCALADGHTVSVVTRGQKLLPVGVQAIVADRKDRSAFALAITQEKRRWDLVIDCIGYEKDDAEQDVAVFAGCADHLIFISTDFVLSPLDRPYNIDETYCRWNDTSYGIGKRAAEEVLIRFADTSPHMRATIFRPCHIYGPGSLLGCIPAHGRDAQLIERIERGETLSIVGGGHFLQQPVFAEDLWPMAKSCVGKPQTAGEIYFSPGPEVIESREFYRIIAQILNKPCPIAEVPITQYVLEHPEHQSFFTHRVYNTAKAQSHGLALPTTGVRQGLKAHVDSILSMRNQQ